MRMCHFWDQNGPFAPIKSFFGKLLRSLSSNYYRLSLCKILKKFFQQIHSYGDVQFLGTKWPNSPNENFFQKTCSWALFLSFMPICLPKIKVRCLSITEILTIKEYWNPIGWEQFLAITWEPDFSQACSFRRMLMNHKNFRFTQIPDKTNDMIFSKSPKTLFLGHFWPFLVIFAWWGFFPKNPALSHVIWSLTPC